MTDDDYNKLTEQMSSLILEFKPSFNELILIGTSFFSMAVLKTNIANMESTKFYDYLRPIIKDFIHKLEAIDPVLQKIIDTQKEHDEISNI